MLARATRLRLWREHLGRDDGDDADLVDFESGFAAWQASAGALDTWHRKSGEGPRPPGHARPHRPQRVPPLHRMWAHISHRLFVDPDGRPRHLRAADQL